MKRFLTITAALAILAGATGGAFAQPHHDDHGSAMQGHGLNDHGMQGPSMAMRGPSHHDWHKGDRMGRDDWNRGQRIDYRHYHLRKPPRGYEWRQVDGNYILAAAATGLIASIILSSH